MTTIRIRRGTAAEWTSRNPVLGDGEPGLEKDTGRQKVGNGVSRWVDLPYAEPNSPADIGAETPAGAQAKADAAQDNAIEAAATDATTKANARIPLTQRGAANGVAPLDANARVPDVNLPTTLARRPALTALPLTIYAHSYGQDQITHTAGQKYIDLLASRYNTAALVNRSTGGRRAYDLANDALGTDGTYQWTSYGQTGLVVVQVGGINDCQVWNMSQPKAQAGYRGGLRTLLALIASGSRMEADTHPAFFNKTNAQVNSNVTKCSGAKILTGSTAPLSVDFAVPGDGWMIGLNMDDSLSTTSKFTVTDLTTGETLTDWLQGGQFVTDGDNTYGPGAYKITGRTGHVLRFAANTVLAFVDCFLPLSDTPPKVVLVKDPHIPLNTVTDAELDYCGAIVDAVGAEFSNVVVVDPNALGWDKTTMIGSDQGHPNDLGHKFLADCIDSVMQSATFRHSFLETVPPASRADLDFYAPKWKANTAYALGDTVLAPDGSLVKAKAAFTSGATYSAANWTSAATYAGTQAKTELDAVYVQILVDGGTPSASGAALLDGGTP